MIGRAAEKARLAKYAESEESEFVAVYGRRRVGKTYLIRQTFQGRFTFQHTGVARGSTKEQLRAFGDSLREWGAKLEGSPKDWFEAFNLLKPVIAKSILRRKVVFLDELSYLDTKGSRFIPALEHFWNGWASARDDVLLIVCGSATSWIINKVIKDKGGLHNRVTGRISLQPFTLKECEEYVASRGIVMTRYQIAETYMVLGGIPFYWKHLEPDLSAGQNIDDLFFARSNKLEGEFDELYASLFRKPEPYLKIVMALGRRKAGLTRDELMSRTGMSSCGNLTRYLRELEECGFLRKSIAFGKKTKGALYQLIDNFTLFHFAFAGENKTGDRCFWSGSSDAQFRRVWEGLAFERLCLQHVREIKIALGISGVVSNDCSWQVARTAEHDGAQVDLLIDRKDGVINLCEMKFSSTEYEIKDSEDRRARERKELFRETTGTKKAVHLTYVTTYGLKRNKHSGIVQSEVTLDDLFRSL
ncbi:MAG: AAA family ATPase [Kiritimatiellae bacterium]|nr:AAA family ATPase [Kiritimatiellia bacterium]MBQ3343984.1 AAA family ATPase [Kiritimatiellia bacterium]